MPPIKLTERQAAFLAEVQQHGFDIGEWFRPMDIGGHNRSDHSALLRELAAKGLIDVRWRMGPGGKWSRGSKLYRLNETGRAWRA